MSVRGILLFVSTNLYINEFVILMHALTKFIVINCTSFNFKTGTVLIIQ